MILAQISDSHIRVPCYEETNDRKRINSLEKCVEAINSLKVRPDAVIHTGDLTDNGLQEEYLIARSILNALSVPCYLTPGNRDGSKAMIKAFENHYPFVNFDFVMYAIEEFPVRIVAMDSLAKHGNKGDFSEEKLNALDRLLAQSKMHPTALFMHHPPFNVSISGDPYFEFDSVDSTVEFQNITSKHNQIVGLFCGHIHRPYKTKLGSFLATVAPSVMPELNFGKDANSEGKNALYTMHYFNVNDGFSSKMLYA